METSRRRTVSVRQLELLIEFLEGHRDLALGRVRSREARATAARLWAACTEILNAEGASRTPKEWSRFWNDYKCRVRSKLVAIRRHTVGTGGGPSTSLQLSQLEERVAAIIGTDVGPLPGVRMDPVMDVENEEEIELVAVDEGIGANESNSPALNLSSVPNFNTEDMGRDRTPTLPSPTGASPNALFSTAAEDVPSAIPNRASSDPEQNMRRGRRSIRPRIRRHLQQSNTAALDEARATIARLEEIRARTEEATAVASVRTAEALLEMASSLRIIAQSVRSYLLPNNRD